MKITKLSPSSPPAGKRLRIKTESMFSTSPTSPFQSYNIQFISFRCLLLLCSPVHLQCLCKLKHVVVVSKQVGHADCEVKLQLVLLFLVSYRKPRLVEYPHPVWFSQETDVCGGAVFRNRTHDVRGDEGKTKVVRVL